jgi:AcrR family transcriptional regulator
LNALYSLVTTLSNVSCRNYLVSDNSDGPRRSYVSDVRREQAAATRLRIAEAARDLMVGQGYAATTMGAVARAAGVAVQTLYSSCPGGKPALARLVYDVTLAGDGAAVPQSDRPQVHAIIAEPDPARKLAGYAAMATDVMRRIRPVYRVLRAAAATTPDDTALAALLSTAEQQRRNGAGSAARHFADVGALRDGLTADRAADQLYALTSIEVYERLTETCGWSDDDFEAWLTDVLVATLLPA